MADAIIALIGHEIRKVYCLEKCSSDFFFLVRTEKQYGKMERRYDKSGKYYDKTEKQYGETEEHFCKIEKEHGFNKL